MGIYGTRDGKFTVKKLEVADKMPMQYVVPKTVAYATGALVSNWNTRTGTAAKDNTDLLVQMPYAMPVGICANVAGTAGGTDTIVVTGYDAKGQALTESVAVAATAAEVHYTDNCFAKITTVQPYPRIPVPKSTSIGVGYRPLIIGLPYDIDAASDLLTMTYDGAYATTALTVDTAYDKITLSTTAAAKTISVLYNSKVQK